MGTVRERGECHLGMQVVRGTDMDGIGLLFREHFPIVGIDGESQTETSAERLSLFGENIADRDEVLPRRENPRDMVPADRARADKTHSHAFLSPKEPPRSVTVSAPSLRRDTARRLLSSVR